MAEKAGDVYVNVGARFNDLDRNFSQLTSRMQSGFNKISSKLTNVFSGLGGTIAAAFSVRAIADFTLEGLKLAGVMEGVQQAYTRMADPDLMNRLKEATRGTVTELELMQTVTKANALGLSLQSLPQLLEFARRRAKDTGMEVDYLVQSIVTGIGRKSPLILDNLGISATQLREKLNGVSIESASIADITKAVGEIAEEAYAGISEGAMTSAEESAILNTKLTELQTKIGQKLTPVANEFKKAMVEALSVASDMLEDDGAIKEYNLNWDLFTNNLEETQRVAGLLEQALGRSLTPLERGRILWSNYTDEQLKLAESQRLLNIELENNRKKWGEIQGPLEDASFAASEYNDQILLLRKSLGLGTPTQTEQETPSGSVAQLTEKLKEAKQAQLKATTTEEWERYGDAIALIEGKINLITGALNEMTSAQINAQKVTDDFFEKLGEDIKSQKIVDIGPKINLDPQPIQDFRDEFLAADAEFQTFLQNSVTNVQKMKEQMQITQGVAQGLASGFQQLGHALVGNLGTAETAAGRFAQSFLSGAVDLVAQMLAVSMASSIAGASQSGAATGPAALFTTPAFIAQAISTVLGAFAAIPAFAKGGQSRGGMALVGERGPELVNLAKGAMVTPHHQMRGALNTRNMAITVNVEGNLRGQTIYLASSRGQTNLNR